ncbi:MAG TPA: MBOAT family O-acyltransferase [Anaerolineaceae bacterium]|nr:MBOAT family O-acyltransferase [Anaerolineaceae bacterium]
MTLTNILIFAALILAYRLILRERWRGWLLFGVSVIAVYWLQPALPIRGLDFWLPTATLALVVFGWAATAPQEDRRTRENWVTAVALLALVLLIATTRYLSLTGLLTPSRPPQTVSVLVVLAIIALIGWLLVRFTRPVSAGLTAFIVVIILVFLALKIPQVTQPLSALFRSLAGQSVERASAIDIRWLGFSYVAFRLIATLRDRQTGRLPSITLREYITYLIFFPALTAGPIDRPERFLKDLLGSHPPSASEFLIGGQRLAVGLFKKFVVADALALLALSSANADKIQTAGWLWVAVAAYSLLIYFDFSGYTDIAIGLARWLGIALPENFNHPYLKPNLTQFWNNWHMTLTQWFRAYFFNPLTRALRSAARPVSVVWVILITQVSTFLLIGLWHGGTPNFLLWGLWHGLGQFIQNRYSDFMKPRITGLDNRPTLKRILSIAGTALTFIYVTLGWVWFALPTTGQALQVFARLFGS